MALFLIGLGVALGVYVLAVVGVYALSAFNARQIPEWTRR